MGNFEEYFEKDKKELQLLFGDQNLKFEMWDMRRTYCTYRTEVQGIKLITSFYDDECYIPSDKRTKDKVGKLSVFYIEDGKIISKYSFQKNVLRHEYKTGNIVNLNDLLVKWQLVQPEVIDESSYEDSEDELEMD